MVPRMNIEMFVCIRVELKKTRKFYEREIEREMFERTYKYLANKSRSWRSLTVYVFI